jgi:hypothetical protein
LEQIPEDFQCCRKGLLERLVRLGRRIAEKKAAWDEVLEAVLWVVLEHRKAYIYVLTA